MWICKYCEMQNDDWESECYLCGKPQKEPEPVVAEEKPKPIVSEEKAKPVVTEEKPNFVVVEEKAKPVVAEEKSVERANGQIVGEPSYKNVQPSVAKFASFFESAVIENEEYIPAQQEVEPDESDFETVSDVEDEKPNIWLEYLYNSLSIPETITTEEEDDDADMKIFAPGQDDSVRFDSVFSADASQQAPENPIAENDSYLPEAESCKQPVVSIDPVSIAIPEEMPSGPTDVSVSPASVFVPAEFSEYKPNEPLVSQHTNNFYRTEQEDSRVSSDLPPAQDFSRREKTTDFDLNQFISQIRQSTSERITDEIRKKQEERRNQPPVMPPVQQPDASDASPRAMKKQQKAEKRRLAVALLCSALKKITAVIMLIYLGMAALFLTVSLLDGNGADLHDMIDEMFYAFEMQLRDFLYWIRY